MKSWRYGFLVFLGGGCYGILSTFVKLAYEAGYSVSEVTGGQFIFGTVLIWSLVLFTKKQKITLRNLFTLLLSGLPLGLTGVFYYLALQTLSASLAIIFLFQFVWIGSLLEWIMYKKKPTKGMMVSIVILMIGSILAAGAFSHGGENVRVEGTVWGLLSAVSYTAFIYMSSSVAKDTPPVLKSALLATGGLMIVMIIFPPSYLLNVPVLMEVAPYGLFLGLFGVALPPLLFSIGMPYVGPGLGTILTSSELPVAVTLSSLILGENVSRFQWMGVGLILAGIVIGNRKTKRNKPGRD